MDKLLIAYGVITLTAITSLQFCALTFRRLRCKPTGL